VSRVLLTTVCRPLGGPDEGPSMGVDVMRGQLCIDQGPLRTAGVGWAYGLEYIAANLASPTTVLHWPSEGELIRELLRGDYDTVGVSYTFQLVPRLSRLVALVRTYAPRARLVLGGYGTAARETWRLGDEVCHGDGIAFMRALLGERVGEPVEHPTIVYGNTLLSLPIDAGRKIMICTGLGCATGCDFCASSARFRRAYQPLVPDGDALFAVMDDLHQRTGIDEFQVFDENFLVDRPRAERLADLCQQHGRHFDFFTFASLRSLAGYTAEELVRIGVSAVWVGLEGKQAGYSKLRGERLATLIARLRRVGILVVGSMIVGFDYHTPAVIHEELEEILDAEPTYLQCLIYGPTPGTALWDRLERQGRWRGGPPGRGGVPYERCDGYQLGFEHPHMDATQLEGLQRHCTREDFRRHGPSIYRAVGTWYEGWRTLRDAREPWLRARAEVYERKLRGCRPLLPVGIARAPTPAVRSRLVGLRDRLDAAFGPAGPRERIIASAVLPAAERWTRFALRYPALQQPRLIRRRYRW
jgi:hypothetical protein